MRGRDLNKITVVLGNTETEILKANEILKCKEEYTQTVYFPEARKHPREYTKEVLELAKSYSKVTDNLIILTFSEDLINFLGLSIKEKKIDCKDIDVITTWKDTKGELEFKHSYYDEEGMLNDYPLDYLSYNY